MLDQICAHIHNWFTGPGEVRRGRFEIANGTLAVDFLKEGQYFRIVGSALNDGVYQYPAEDLADEVFTGEIWPMKVPKAVRDLAVEIAAWQAKYGEATASPFQSENVIGVYSYQKRAGGSAGSAWQSAFGPRLNPWRKLS